MSEAPSERDAGAARHPAVTADAAGGAAPDELALDDPCRTAALRRLGRRSFAPASLVDRLVRDGHEPDHARGVVEALVRDGWLDVRQAAVDRLQALTRSRPADPEWLTRRLVEHGFEADLAAAVVQQHGPDRTATVRAAVDAELARVRVRPVPEAALRRLAGRLARRGFEADDIRSALAFHGVTPDSASGAHDAPDDVDALDAFPPEDTSSDPFPPDLFPPHGPRHD